ncbi:MAG: FKBP-type peptidyl-prolyl cis-trans isomerase [Arenicella sp.]
MKNFLTLLVASMLMLTACKPSAETGASKDASEAAATTEEQAKEAASVAESKAADMVEEVKEEVKEAMTEGDTAEVKSAYETDSERLGYAFGHQFANSLVSNDLKDEVSAQALTEAILAVFAGTDSKMTEEEMKNAVDAFRTRKQAEAQAAALESKAKGVEFLAANKAKPDVKTTESGLQYKVIKEGKGAMPEAGKSVEVNYKGSLIDGTVFDSSYDRGQSATFPLDGVIPGFSEGLKLMKEGAKYEFYIPSDLAYGENGPPSIGPSQTLIFEVELIKVQ